MNVKVRAQKRGHLQLIAFSAVDWGRSRLDKESSLFNRLAPDVVDKGKLSVILVLSVADRVG